MFEGDWLRSLSSNDRCKQSSSPNKTISWPLYFTGHIQLQEGDFKYTVYKVDKQVVTADQVLATTSQYKESQSVGSYMFWHSHSINLSTPIIWISVSYWNEYSQLVIYYLPSAINRCNIISLFSGVRDVIQPSFGPCIWCMHLTIHSLVFVVSFLPAI